MTGRMAAAVLGVILAFVASPALAQFKVDDSTTQAIKTRDLNNLAPMITAVDARKRYFPPTSAEMRKRGMAEAPALTVEAGLDCHVADARWIGDLDASHGRGKAAFYEIACAGDLGFILTKTKGAPAQAVTCLEMAIARPRAGRNDLRCDLPENRDPRVGLVSYVARTGKDCPPDRVREIGHSPTRTAFELACGGGGGFIMMTSTPPRLDRPIDIHPCFSYAEGGTVSCLYTDRKAQLAMVDHLASQAGIPCAIKDRAYIGESGRDGDSFWEAACQDGHGYLLKQGLDGRLARAVDCASAGLILAGGCQLTDSRAARADQATIYGREVAAAGFLCQVSDYLVHAKRSDGAQAVELACADRPAGAVAFFPATGPAVVIDCAHVQLMGYDCRLSRASVAYPALTADLRALGRTTCAVSDARAVGVTADHHAFAEVACDDGLQGFMIEYRLNPIAPLQATVCAEAARVGSGCALPGNRHG
jgi:hypothetical protein